MSLKQRIDADLKAALLAKDVTKVSTLKMVKSAILNEEIAAGTRDEGLSDEHIQQLLKKEQKKRIEAAELYKKAGSTDRATQEESEAQVIQAYLPELMSEAELIKIVEDVIAKYDNPTPVRIGEIIGQVRVKTGGRAEGSDIARLVKAKLT